jgi:DNA-binding transcriptional LysR family regulator
MHLRNLKVFCDVVDRRSFSRAAADNDMTQSGASQVVQHLEEFLQVQLIDRSKRPFLLTAEGRAFHGGCVQILRQFESLTEEVRAIGSEVSGRASVAAIYSVGLSYLPELQRRVKARHPKADVRYQFGQPDEVYRLVEQGIVDFGLVSYPQSSKTVLASTWLEERMLLTCPPQHPLAGVSEVSLHELKSQSLIAFAPNLRIRHEIDRFLRHLGVTMKIAAEFDNIDSVKHGMEVNDAVAFLPEPTVREELESGSLFAPNCPWLKLNRPLGLIQRRDSTLSRTARGVMELILDHTFEASSECAATESRSTDGVDDQADGRADGAGRHHMHGSTNGAVGVQR